MNPNCNMDPLPPIPTPPAQRWREFRIQILPVLVFIGIITMIALMWRSVIVPSGVSGDAEGATAEADSLHYAKQ